MTWVKICGNTNLEDARAAVDAGADALGFIFAPSVRRISPKDAGKIVAELPEEIEKIGVFLNQSAEIVRDTVEAAGLTGVQLHGEEDVEFARGLHGPKLRIYKTISMANADAAMVKGAALADEVFFALLLDSSAGQQQGGTGKTFDWGEAAPVARFLSRKMKIIVAGGLTAENVGDAVRRFQPWGVDVASGVEREPGRKDWDKVRAFVAAAKEAGGREETQGPSTRARAHSLARPRSG